MAGLKMGNSRNDWIPATTSPTDGICGWTESNSRLTSWEMSCANRATMDAMNMWGANTEKTCDQLMSLLNGMKGLIVDRES